MGGGEKQIGGNFSSICVFSSSSRRGVNLFITESRKVKNSLESVSLENWLKSMFFPLSWYE